MRALLLSLLVACTAGDNIDGTRTDGGSFACSFADPTCSHSPTCTDLRALTERSPRAEAAIPGDVQILDDQDFYVCAYDMPPISDVTWTTVPRRRIDDGSTGAIVVTPIGPTYRCEWVESIEVRDIATGMCGGEQ